MNINISIWVVWRLRFVDPRGTVRRLSLRNAPCWVCARRRPNQLNISTYFTTDFRLLSFFFSSWPWIWAVVQALLILCRRSFDTCMNRHSTPTIKKIGDFWWQLLLILMYFEFSWIGRFVSCATESYKKVVVNFKKWTVNSIVQLQIKINAKASYKQS